MTSPRQRGRELIVQAIQELELDLRGRVVLTEVGSNHFVYAPLVAALAGADRVYAWARDSVHGSAAAIQAQLEECLDSSLRACIVVRCNERRAQDVREADIITNSGALRPLDRALLEQARPGCVVPLMFEAWELRAQDLDLDYCRERGLKVAGTNESHPRVGVFASVGALALKLAFEAGFEVCGNRVLVWSGDAFGHVSADALRAVGAHVTLTTSPADFYAQLPQLDFVYLCDYRETRPYFGPDAIFDLDEIHRVNRHLGVVHLYGDVLESVDLPLYPRQQGQPHRMTRTLAHLGPRPVIYLQAAGLRVAQELLAGKLSDLTQPLV